MRCVLFVVRSGCSLFLPRCAGAVPWLIVEVINVLEAAILSESKVVIIDSGIVELIESSLRSSAFRPRFRFA
jgi:hypothetical protein